MSDNLELTMDEIQMTDIGVPLSQCSYKSHFKAAEAVAKAQLAKALPILEAQKQQAVEDRTREILQEFEFIMNDSKLGMYMANVERKIEQLRLHYGIKDVRG